MRDRAMHVYLNDHLAGAMLGSDLAGQIRRRHEGTPLGAAMGPVAVQIEEDRQTLLELMKRIGVSRNPVKQATGWVAEKISRVKFSGTISREPDQGAFLALESLALGVKGKASMWTALKEVVSQYPQLASTALDELIERAETQYTTLERERLAAVRRALARSAEPGE